MYEGKFISNIYVDQYVKLRLDQGESISVKTGRRFRQGCWL